MSAIIRLRPRGEAVTSPLPPDASPVPVDDPYAVWAARARNAGHPVLAVLPGRMHSDPMPIWLHTMPPNDLLDAAKEYARSRVAWVHVVMPSAADALTLGAAVLGPRPSGPAVRAGSPAGLPFQRLVAQQRIAPSAVSETVDGTTTHAVEIPVSWLAHPVLRVDAPERLPLRRIGRAGSPAR